MYTCLVYSCCDSIECVVSHSIECGDSIECVDSIECDSIECVVSHSGRVRGWCEGLNDCPHCINCF